MAGRRHLLTLSLTGKDQDHRLRSVLLAWVCRSIRLLRFLVYSACSKWYLRASICAAGLISAQTVRPIEAPHSHNSLKDTHAEKCIIKQHQVKEQESCAIAKRSTRCALAFLTDLYNPTIRTWFVARKSTCTIQYRLLGSTGKIGQKLPSRWP